MDTFVYFNLEFDHAIQYYSNRTTGQSWSSTVTSGDIKVGNPSNTASEEYTAEMVFRLSNPEALAYYISTWTIYCNTSPEERSATETRRNFAYYYGICYGNESSLPIINRSMSFIYPDHAVTGNANSAKYDDRATVINKLNNATLFTVKLETYDSSQQYNIYNYAVFHNIESSYLQLSGKTLDFSISNVYPIGINCRNDRLINITWDYSNPRNFEYNNQPLYYPILSTVTVTQGQTERTFTNSESFISCPIPANELTPGETTYKVTLTYNDNDTYDSPEQTFTVIGQTSAPEITNITQDSFPTITWICADQAAWELLIRDSNSVVYHSDMKAGTEQSYTLPVMLEDGSYSVEMRALNIYGYYTDWGSYGFALSPTKPTAATNLIVSTNANYTVTIDCTAPEDAGTLYVVRRRTPNEKAVIIGEYNNGFTDYYVPVNTTYEYAVRNYVTGYADTDFIDATIKCPGVVIRDGEDLTRFIPLWKNDNEEFDVISNNSRSDTLVQCLGRKYPVNEIGEWLTSTRSFTAHVSSSDMLKLNDININSKCVYIQNKDECIPCKMEIDDAGEYNGGGRIINFTLTRIDEEMA